MKREIKKVAKMVDEITTFFLEFQAQEVKVNIFTYKDRIVITASAKKLKKSEKAVRRLKQYLSYPRAHEMEEYYWALTGESECEEGLAIVGTMVDEASIDYDDEHIDIHLTRLIGKR
ncbi:MAG: hypothetical protein ATN34_03250 [Epulopiscium sp. Nele67-Bin002]|nr:MAG: hypothetical protein BEN18_00345 [Epulopiscium sp. Nuni2H_MBin001]OON91526.1 MAG: hypothetical protein ATN34_03250 [Epulopiscium sp. Nele67-Bin002]OON91598.1 MAG: hypothetical protein ATN33_08940 [Epulopiscium sp. Nele67-Bin001]